jgi:hypothetical protein
MVGPCPLYLDLLSLGALGMLHLEFGGGVGSHLGTKMELSEQVPKIASW